MFKFEVLKHLKIPKVAYVAILGLVVCIFYVFRSQFRLTEQKPIREPIRNPYASAISGVGIVESHGDNVQIAPFIGGRVKEVLVVEGDSVKAGDILYKLDTRELEAQRSSQQAAYAGLRAAYSRLKNSPRPEDIPPLEAVVRTRQAEYSELADNLRKLEDLPDKRSISRDEYDRKVAQLKQAKSRLEESEANLAKLKAGPWKYDLQQALAESQAASSKVKEIETLIAQSSVDSPLDGTVLQVNIRPGEYASPNSPVPSMIVGRNNKMQVRVDIDEVNASRVRPNMSATAFLKGDKDRKFNLDFVRIEPYMVPKKNLTGDTAERNDVRVLQVIYEFYPPDFPVYVGQQVEVYLQKASPQ